MSTTHGGRQKNFEWQLVRNNILIENEEGREHLYSLSEIIKITQWLGDIFGEGWFPLANNVASLGRAEEKDGLGVAILQSSPGDITHAQGSSYLGVILEEVGIFEWNGEKRGIQWRIAKMPGSITELADLIKNCLIDSVQATSAQNLNAVKSTRKTGSESFHIDGKSLPETLLSFWQWSSSELVGNALRGGLAEFIVASDLGCVEGVRQQWDAYDLITPDGIKIEVKSAAYLQRWSQKKLSSIKFGIQPTRHWDAEIKKRSLTKIRQADVYVFCLLIHQDKDTVDPLNLDQWEFYVLSTEVLDRKLGEQKSVSLATLQKLNPSRVGYGSIREAVKRQFV